MKTELRMESLAWQGYGVGRSGGKVWFVPFTHPGDLILAEPVKEKKSFVHGRITEILEPSADRIPAPCPLFGKCGGCNWQMVSYENQIRTKESILADTFKRNRLELPDDFTITPAPSKWHYRNRIQMRFSSDGLPGFYRQGSKEVIPVSSCLLAEEELDRGIGAVYSDAEKNPRGPSGKYPSGFELRLKDGGGTEIIGLDSKESSAGDFSQVNREVNLLLKKEVEKCLDSMAPDRDDLRITDLYCGDGNLSLPLAERCSWIKGWDGSASAVSRGNRLAEEAGIKGNRVKYFRGYIEKCRKVIARETGDSDILILDPPRRGIKGQTDFIGSLDVENIIYVSCSPPTLVRDLKALTGFGYKIESVRIFDMFPQTYHMETLVRLRK